MEKQLNRPEQEKFQKRFNLFLEMAIKYQNHYSAGFSHTYPANHLIISTDNLFKGNDSRLDNLQERLDYLIPEFIEEEGKEKIKDLTKIIENYIAGVNLLPEGTWEKIEKEGIKEGIDEIISFFSETDHAHFVGGVNSGSHKIYNDIITIQSHSLWIKEGDESSLRKLKGDELTEISNNIYHEVRKPGSKASEVLPCCLEDLSITLSDGRKVYLKEGVISKNKNSRDIMFTKSLDLRNAYWKWNGDQLKKITNKAVRLVREVCETETPSYVMHATAAGYNHLVQRITNLLKVQTDSSIDLSKPLLKSLTKLEAAATNLKFPEYIQYEYVNSIQETALVAAEAKVTFQRYHEEKQYRTDFFNMLDNRLYAIAEGLGKIAEKNWDIRNTILLETPR